MSLLDNIDITMLKGDIEMAKQELMLKIGDLKIELTRKINSDDFSYANNQINIKLNVLDEVINAYRNKLYMFERKLEHMDEWFTQIATYAQYTSNQEFKEITNKITEYKSIEE